MRKLGVVDDEFLSKGAERNDPFVLLNGPFYLNFSFVKVHAHYLFPSLVLDM